MGLLLMLLNNAASLRSRLRSTGSHNIVHVNILPELTQKTESICGDKGLSEDTISQLLWSLKDYYHVHIRAAIDPP
jgi:hypothetical protein